MKVIITGLPELVKENQELLGELFLTAMYFNNFKVDGVKIEFEAEQHEHVLDYSVNPAGTCTVCGYND
jgi:hypothetical protein